MKKPNHSNDNSGQNYDPATGKYIADSDAGGNLVDKALLTPDIQGDFTEEFWNDFIAKASEGIEEKKYPAEIESNKEKILSNIGKLLSDDEKKEFLDVLSGISDDDIRKNYVDVLVGRKNIPPVKFMKMPLGAKEAAAGYLAATHTIVFNTAYYKNGIHSYDEGHPFSTLFHEMAHAMDAILERDGFSIGNATGNEEYSTARRDLRETIVSDINKLAKPEEKDENGKTKKEGKPGYKVLCDIVQEYVQSQLDKKMEGKDGMPSDVVMNIATELPCFFDIIDYCRTKDPYGVKFKLPISHKNKDGKEIKATVEIGHTAKYWSNDKTAIGKEAFAEISQTIAAMPHMIGMIEKYLPSTCARYKEIMKAMREKGDKENEQNKKE